MPILSRLLELVRRQQPDGPVAAGSGGDTRSLGVWDESVWDGDDVYDVESRPAAGAEGE
jgi:hypothetical protein